MIKCNNIIQYSCSIIIQRIKAAAAIDETLDRELGDLVGIEPTAVGSASTGLLVKL